MLSIFENDFTIEHEIYARMKNDFDDLTEDEFEDELGDILHEELDNYVNCMYNGEVNKLMVEIGFDKAMDMYITEFGAIESGITSKTLLYVCIKNELYEKVSFENFIKFTKED